MNCVTRLCPCSGRPPLPSKQGGPSEVSDTERDLQKVLSAERGFSPAVWQRSAELMQDVCEWQVEYRGKSRSLWEELQRVGVTDLLLRCFLLPLIAWTEERMSDADGAHVEIKRLTRLQTEVGDKTHRVLETAAGGTRCGGSATTACPHPLR